MTARRPDQSPGERSSWLDPATAVALSALPAELRRAALSRLEAASDAAGSPPLASILETVVNADPRAAQRMAEQALTAAALDLSAAGATGDQAVTLGSQEYPSGLAEIPDPPFLLWVRGCREALLAPAVAIVGSRAASPYALEMAATLAGDLTRLGLVVVSGLARGVDGAAHDAALVRGRTVAVLGCGVDRVYPPEHADLAGRIARAGALVSELPPGRPPIASHFPRRNRLISGLSWAVVIVEASERSGSLITARCALEQGREVMVVPGNALTGRNRGGHALLRDGARLVESAAEVVEEIRPMIGSRWPDLELSAGMSAGPSAGGETPGGVTALLAALPPGEAVDVDTLVARTGEDARALLHQMLSLELEGRVFRAGGGRFVRAKR